MTELRPKVLDKPELARYVLNGIVATVVHYSVLTVNLELFEMPSAGLANLIAAVFGISCSFIGSRYFVFKAREGGVLGQARRFLLLYALIACLHGAILFAWTDIYGLDYRLGFLLATGVQVALSYFGNKRLVFRL